MVTTFSRILAAGLIAGSIAGTAITVAEIPLVTPLILAAEVFEQASSSTPPPSDHSGASQLGDGDERAWAPTAGLERLAFTWLANVLTGVGFGLIFAAAIALAGRPMDWRRGLIWGLAGYGVFAVAPALGLPPELPGMVTADLAARQKWWLAAAGSAAAGLALIAFAPEQPFKRPLQAAGLILMILPHLSGAPHLAYAVGVVPPELAARFVVASLAASALFWVILGVTVGHLMAHRLSFSLRGAKNAGITGS